MTELKGLSNEELSTLGLEAAEACVRRYREIAEASDPSDLPLRELLGRLAQEAALQAEAIRLYEGRRLGSGPPGRLAELKQLIREFLASLSKGFGEGFLHRDNALFFAESLEEEVSRFYRRLAEQARDWEPVTFFGDLSERERRKLRYLRDVVLQV